MNGSISPKRCALKQLSIVVFLLCASHKDSILWPTWSGSLLSVVNQHQLQWTSTTQGEQGCRSGESARLRPMCPGFDSRTRRHMWVEFVVGSLPCSERFFSGYSGFPLSSKTNISKFQFDLELSSSLTVNLWLGWLRKHSRCLTLNLQLHFLHVLQ